MANATFTTLLSSEITNDYGNRYTISLIHRTAGIHSAGSSGVMGGEAWLVRVQSRGEATFHGSKHADKFDALEAYNRRIGTYVNVSA